MPNAKKHEFNSQMQWTYVNPTLCECLPVFAKNETWRVDVKLTWSYSLHLDAQDSCRFTFSVLPAASARVDCWPAPWYSAGPANSDKDSLKQSNIDLDDRTASESHRVAIQDPANHTAFSFGISLGFTWPLVYTCLHLLTVYIILHIKWLHFCVSCSFCRCVRWRPRRLSETMRSIFCSKGSTLPIAFDMHREIVWRELKLSNRM